MKYRYVILERELTWLIYDQVQHRKIAEFYAMESAIEVRDWLNSQLDLPLSEPAHSQ